MYQILYLKLEDAINRTFKLWYFIRRVDIYFNFAFKCVKFMFNWKENKTVNLYNLGVFIFLSYSPGKKIYLTGYLLNIKKDIHKIGLLKIIYLAFKIYYWKKSLQSNVARKGTCLFVLPAQLA